MDQTHSHALHWPAEAVRDSKDGTRWSQPGSNICLDFHGDPLRAELVVFSDGNHHMALEESLRAFRQCYPDVKDIFYATTPPSVLLNLLHQGELHLGNLCLSVVPHVFISPDDVIEKLASSGVMKTHDAFMQSQGNVLIYRRGNPKNIQSIEDILRTDVRLFISNPVNEAASYTTYRDSVLGIAQQAGLDVAAFQYKLSESCAQTLFGENIHHRELPQAFADDDVDVAVVFYHLALRYSRIFPQLFDWLALGGTREQPRPLPGNVITHYRMGLVHDGGEWGPRLIDFMLSEQATSIYQSHGLLRPQ